MTSRRRSRNLSLAAWAAISAILLETAFPAVSFALHSTPTVCQCSANGGECHCVGGCCSGNKASKSKSCCATKQATPQRSCCSTNEKSDATKEDVPACCRNKAASTQCPSVPPAATQRLQKTPPKPAPMSVEGQCGCGDRPDTMTGEAPPRLVPAKQSATLSMIDLDRIGDAANLYRSVATKPESPPPRAVA